MAYASAAAVWCLQATAAGLKMLAQELTSGGGAAAAQLRVAEQYVEVMGLLWGPETEKCRTQLFMLVTATVTEWLCVSCLFCCVKCRRRFHT